MKALVLGAAGQLGRALQVSAPGNATVVALPRDKCDLGDRDAVRRAVAETAPDVVFNAAAYTAVDAAEDNVGDAELVNRDAPGWIAVAAAEVGARLVHVSTDFVFSGDSPTPYAVDAPTSPLSVYGRTKRDGEAKVLSASEAHLVVRTSWVYASTGRNFVLTMMRLMKERGAVAVVSDQVGSPTWAASLAETLWELAGLHASGVMHVTDAGVASWYDFAVAIAEEGAGAGLLPPGTVVTPISSAAFPARARRPAFSVLDKSLTTGLLGRELPYWRANLRLMIKEVQSLG